MTSYAQLQDQIAPYDLIGFRGGDGISDFISYLETKNLGIGTFSHVGMVVTSEILPRYQFKGKEFDLIPGKLYVLESTFSYKVPKIMDNVPDVITGKGKLGVQLRDLEEVIPHYIINSTTKVAWCRLRNNPFHPVPDEPAADYAIRRQALQDQFQVLFEEYYGRRYELDMVSLFGAMFPCLRTLRRGRDAFYNGLYQCLHLNPKRSPAGWQFCSELVANIYQAIGIIPETLNPKDVMPVDFLGCDADGLPALVDAPVFIADRDL